MMTEHNHADPKSVGGSTSHPELAKRIYLAVASYKANISYATMEKRFEDSGERIDASWNLVADKLYAAVSEAVSERLRGLFGG